MLDNYYVYKKEVDWSLLNQGLSIPLDFQVVFQNNIKKFINRGESKEIYLVLDGISYNVKLVNQKFDESRYPNHKDILQIRYNPTSDLADRLRQIFSYTYQYLNDQRNNSGDTQRRHFRIPADRKEFLAVYTTEYADTYLLECITHAEAAEARGFLAKEDEQSYEVSINYPATDPTALIDKIQQLAKIRRLNRAIGDNLKLFYGYRCQICGEDFGKKFDVHIVESHHIDHFVVSMNNDAVNQIIICPNHHRIIHRAEPVFDRRRQLFIYRNGTEERLVLNRHLSA